MNDISRVQLQDGSVYNIKDNDLRRRLEILLGPIKKEEEQNSEVNKTEE